MPKDGPEGRNKKEGATRNLERLRHVRPGPDPGVQGGLQHDRPEQGRFYRPRRPEGHVGLSRQGNAHCLNANSRYWRFAQ